MALLLPLIVIFYYFGCLYNIWAERSPGHCSYEDCFDFLGEEEEKDWTSVCCPNVYNLFYLLSCVCPSISLHMSEFLKAKLSSGLSDRLTHVTSKRVALMVILELLSCLHSLLRTGHTTFFCILVVLLKHVSRQRKMGLLPLINRQDKYFFADFLKLAGWDWRGRERSRRSVYVKYVLKPTSFYAVINVKGRNAFRNSCAPDSFLFPETSSLFMPDAIGIQW